LLAVNLFDAVGGQTIVSSTSSFGVDLNPKPYRFGFFFAKSSAGHASPRASCFSRSGVEDSV
jgi:hypothetical protein